MMYIVGTNDKGGTFFVQGAGKLGLSLSLLSALGSRLRQGETVSDVDFSGPVPDPRKLGLGTIRDWLGMVPSVRMVRLMPPFFAQRLNVKSLMPRPRDKQLSVAREDRAVGQVANQAWKHIYNATQNNVR
ncbi:hypothetical protein [Microviridae sp.]|nr:hypothetical protein [Microviridae sp.]